VIAKRLDLAYASGERAAMQKVKRMRTPIVWWADFVTRRMPSRRLFALGLYDEKGLLHHVGFTSVSITRKERVDDDFETADQGTSFTGNKPGGPSRWSTKRSAEWEPLKTKLVAEVQYDHFSGGRFRHGTRFLRWFLDKKPRQCDFDQIPAPGGSRRVDGNSVQSTASAGFTPTLQ